MDSNRGMLAPGLDAPRTDLIGPTIPQCTGRSVSASANKRELLDEIAIDFASVARSSFVKPAMRELMAEETGTVASQRERQRCRRKATDATTVDSQRAPHVQMYKRHRENRGRSVRRNGIIGKRRCGCPSTVTACAWRSNINEIGSILSQPMAT